MVNQDTIGPSDSFGIASQWVYENYIRDNTTDIFVCMENDIFPFKNINIEEYVKIMKFAEMLDLMHSIYQIE